MCRESENSSRLTKIARHTFTDNANVDWKGGGGMGKGELKSGAFACAKGSVPGIRLRYVPQTTVAR